MNLNFGPRNILEITGARITHRNFTGRGDKYNREGDRNFSLVIPSQEIADALIADENKYGVGWNVKIKAPFEEGGEPFRFLKVKINFNERGPIVYLNTNGKVTRLDEDSISCLDFVDIASVDLNIRPYDDEMRGQPFRAAYLQSMEVFQNIDSIAARYAEEEYPEE